MALPPTIYRTSVQLSDVDRSCYQQLQVTVARHPSETAERLVARLLAYALAYEEGLTFTKGICAGDEPDLWIRGPDGRVILWLEVGLPEAERLLKASRHAERVVLFACGAGRSRWEGVHLPRLSRAVNLTVYGLDRIFLLHLVERLQRGIDWSLTVTAGVIYLSLGHETLESSLAVLVHPGAPTKGP